MTNDSEPPQGSSPATPSGRHIPALDGVRGLAILLVLWEHFGPRSATPPSAGLALIGHNLLHAGWAGVDLFFVLSGFLITGILLDAKAGPLRLRDFPCASGQDDIDRPCRHGRPPAIAYFGTFYARRALRIFPLYYAVLACVAVCTAWLGNPHESGIWRDWAPWLWLYAGNVYNARHGWMAGPHGLLLNHLWSLAVEEQFYLVWPIIVFACGRRSLWFGCWSLIACAVALRFYVEVIDANNYAATLLMPCRLDAFGVGGLLALSVRGEAAKSGAGARQLDRLGWAMCGISAVLILPMFLNFVWMDVLGRCLLAVFFGGLLLLAVFSPLRGVFQLAVLRVFGKYSYGLYVLHFLLYHPIARCFPAQHCGILLHFLGCVAISFALAFCSWHGMEKYFIKLKRHIPVAAVKPRAERSGPPEDAPVTIAAAAW